MSLVRRKVLPDRTGVKRQSGDMWRRIRIAHPEGEHNLARMLDVLARNGLFSRLTPAASLEELAVA
jgi:hypothetical protein